MIGNFVTWSFEEGEKNNGVVRPGSLWTVNSKVHWLPMPRQDLRLPLSSPGPRLFVVYHGRYRLFPNGMIQGGFLQELRLLPGF